MASWYTVVSTNSIMHKLETEPRSIPSRKTSTSVDFTLLAECQNKVICETLITSMGLTRFIGLKLVWVYTDLSVGVGNLSVANCICFCMLGTSHFAERFIALRVA